MAHHQQRYVNGPIASSSSSPPSSLLYPPLPRLSSPPLINLVFSPRIQSDKVDPVTLQNRRLEWLGDSFLHFMITVMLDELFPSATTHLVAHVRSDITSNVCFANISKHYGLLERVRARVKPVKSKLKIGSKMKHHGMSPFPISLTVKWSKMQPFLD